MKKIFFLVAVVMSSFMAQAQLRIGNSAPEISLPGTMDSVISLSSLKGKVVLLDFWASWCGPCRATNPSLVKLYKKYGSKGFEIFSVSIDSKKDAWLKAIQHDKITYTQVNDNAGWNSKVAERYFINEIPTTFLLDKEGKIVAINLEGAALDARVGKMVK